MKKILSVLLVAIFLIGALPAMEVEAALPAYESAIQVQNLDTVAVANISIHVGKGFF